MRGILPAAGGRKRQGTVGYAAGAFDLFHVGHLNILNHSADRCDYLVAGVVSDAVLLQTKGIVPVIPEEERIQIVAALACVDAVYVEREVDRLLTWDDVRFNVFFKGDDWRGTRKGTALEQRLGEQGVRVEYFPYTASTSSTRLRSALDQIESTARAPISTSA